METIQVKDKKFAVSIPEAEILEQVKRVGREISKDMQGKDPVFIAILNGAFMFAADLMREVSIPSRITFVKLTSYSGVSSTGAVKEMIGLNTDISGKDVIIVEDIVDTGLTMKSLLATLSKYNPASVSICSLLVKPEKLEVDIDIPYKCFEIPNDFILGYGLDYDGYGRNTRDIYTVVE